MNIQYVSDAAGKPTAVLVPIKEWERLQKHLPTASEKPVSRPKLTKKEQFKEDFREAVQEMQRGEGRPVAELLDELDEL